MPILREVVACDECGSPGQDPIEDRCNEWIGPPDNGYVCPDVICLDCCMEEIGYMGGDDAEV